jgi:hypothetical protein
MNLSTEHSTATEDDIFAFEVSDEALEAAASTMRNPAFSFPNAPTVSVLFACCGNDVSSAPRSEAQRGRGTTRRVVEGASR